MSENTTVKFTVIKIDDPLSHWLVVEWVDYMLKYPITSGEFFKFHHGFIPARLVGNGKTMGFITDRHTLKISDLGENLIPKIPRILVKAHAKHFTLS